MSGEFWRPMSEAPKDGSERLGCYDGGDPGSPDWYFEVIMWIDLGNGDGAEGWTTCGGYNDRGGYREFIPLRWCPLPPPPAQEAS